MSPKLFLLLTILVLVEGFAVAKRCNSSCQARLAAQQAADDAAAAAKAAALAAAKLAQDATITSLSISRASDNQPVDQFNFDPNVKEYSFDVPAETLSIVFAVRTNSPTASVTANTATMASPIALSSAVSSPFALATGVNAVQITVTSQDKTNTVIYKFTVNQLLSAVVTLSMLQVHLMDGTPVSFYPAFSTDIQRYTLTIPATADGIILTACTKSPTASMFVSLNMYGTPILMTDQNNQTTLPLPADSNAAFISISIQAQNQRAISQTSLTVTRDQPQLSQPQEVQDTLPPLKNLNNNILKKHQEHSNAVRTDIQPDTGGVSRFTVIIALTIAGSILVGYLFASLVFYIKSRLHHKPTEDPRQ